MYHLLLIIHEALESAQSNVSLNEQYIHVVLFITLYKCLTAFDSYADNTLEFNHLNENRLKELSCGVGHYVVASF